MDSETQNSATAQLFFKNINFIIFIIMVKHTLYRKFEKNIATKIRQKRFYLSAVFLFPFKVTIFKVPVVELHVFRKNKSTYKNIKCLFPKSSGNMTSKLLLKQPMILPHFIQL